MQRLPVTTTLLYSQLLQQCTEALVPQHGFSFVSKKTGNKRYWYLQLVVGESRHQYYIGEDSPDLVARIESQRARVKAHKEELENRKRLVSMLVRGGAAAPIGAEARVLEVLEQAGVFRAGGVLVGSHAYATYSNLLGARWEQPALRTEDVDIGAQIHIGLGQEPVDFRSALIKAGIDFFDVPALNHKHPSTKFMVRGTLLKVELLTPLIGKPSTKPILIEKLQYYAEPIRYLDYLIVERVPTVIPARSGILVNVPDPARYALHKLVVSQRRNKSQQAKIRKDLQQAQSLLEVLYEDRPGDVLIAADAAQAMEKSFVRDLLKGAGQLPKTLKEAVEEDLEQARDPVSDPNEHDVPNDPLPSSPGDSGP